MTDDDKVEAMALARCARCHHFNDADRMVVVSYNGATGAVCRSTCRLPEDVIVGELVDLFADGEDRPASHGVDVTVDAPDAREVIARILHQHDSHFARTDDWRDCPSADIHGDVAMRIADALGLEVGE